MKITLNQAGIENIKLKADEYTKTIGDEVVNEAKTLAPVDTGQLRDSITNDKQGQGEYKIIANATYSLFVELKTRFLASALNNIKGMHTWKW